MTDLFDAAFSGQSSWGQPYGGWSSGGWPQGITGTSAGASSVAYTTPEGRIIVRAQNRQTTIPDDDGVDPTKIPGEITLPQVEKSGRSEHNPLNVDKPSHSSFATEEQASVTRGDTSSDALIPGARTGPVSLDSGAAASSLLLFASKFWQRTSMEPNKLPQNFSSDAFTYLYYTVIIPYLDAAIRLLAGKSLSIGVKHQDDERIVEIVTDESISYEAQTELKESLSELLPPGFRTLTTLTFERGKIMRAGDVSDNECQPRNPYQYASLEMGDSIGSKSSDAIATAGPQIQLGDEGYWIHCYHFLDDHYKSQKYIKYKKEPLVTHPARHDLKQFCQHHSGLVNEKVTGQILFHSGGLSATRMRKNGPLGLVDYAVCDQSDSSEPRPNVLRMVNKENKFITTTCEIRPEGLVYSVGRSSGVQIGRVRKEMSFVEGIWSKTESTATFEWTVEWTGEDHTKDEWNVGGMGIEGDSGAGVIDMKSNSLCGQIWGTRGNSQRVAYVTAWNEIVDDIEDKYEQKYGQSLRATLPQLAQNSSNPLDEPSCPGCATERGIYLQSIANELQTIQQASIDATSSRQKTHTRDSGLLTPLPVSISEDINTLLPLKSSKRRKMRSEFGPTRSSATPQEEALHLVDKVLKDLPSILSHGQEWQSDMLETTGSIRAMSEVKPEIMMVAA